MNSVLESKRGNWYEETYVVYQLLRLLLDEVSWLHWDGILPDRESGVDLLLRERGATVAIQVKHHSWPKWKPSELKGVLGYARERLRQRAPFLIDEFRFVSDARSEHLEAAIRAAHEGMSSSSAELGKIAPVLEGLGFAHEEPVQRAEALELCLRLAARFLGGEALDECCELLVRSIEGATHTGGLMEELLRFAKRTVGRQIDRAAVLEAMRSAGRNLQPPIDNTSTASILERNREDFLDEVRQAASALPLDEISQPEVGQIVNECLDLPAGGTVLVHGPGGSGKTTAIAGAIRRLSDPVLVLRADRATEAEMERARDLVATFRAYCGDRRGIVLIDQLDQIRAARDGSQFAMRCVNRWVREVRASGLILLVGCRTVDADRDTQLRQLLTPAPNSPTTKIRVAELPASQVEGELAQRGIPAADLGAGLLRLLCRPLALGLFLGLRQDLGSASICRNSVELMQKWWERIVAAKYPRADEILDALCDFMANTGQLSCPRGHLPAHPGVVDSLLADGVLQRDSTSADRIKPFHQLLTDTRIAMRWGKFGSIQALGEALGPLASQGLSEARRLRLATPVLAATPEVLVGVLASQDVRPILKRAMLAGLADIDDPHHSLLPTVQEWMAAPTSARLVVEWVVHGNPHWARLLEKEIDVAWASGSVDRDVMFRLLYSIDEGATAQVDRHLKRWANADPQVWVQAQNLLWNDPADDTDERFESRLHLERLTGAVSYPATKWDSLVQMHPDRAVRLLDTRVRRVTGPIHQRSAMSLQGDLPRHPLQDIPPVSFGARLLYVIADWWAALDGFSLWEVASYGDGKHDGYDAGILASLVEFVASALAPDLARKEIAWDEVLAMLPEPLREMDGWLLLTIASRLPDDAPEEVADVIVDWMIEDPRWVGVEIGVSDGQRSLVKKALALLGSLVSGFAFRRLEAFLLQYRDEWTKEEEAIRREWPNSRGRTARLLLPALPEDRRSPDATRKLKELERKFGVSERGTCKTAWLSSPVPDDEADRWSPETWIKHLREAPQTGRLRPTSTGFSSYTLSMLASQLNRLARKDPARYLAVAWKFDETVPADARESILQALATIRPRDGSHCAEWEPLEDAEFASLLEKDCYLHEPRCSKAIAWGVIERTAYPWSSGIVERLCQDANRLTSAAGLPLPPAEDGEGFQSYRINDEASLALEALIRLARRDLSVRPRLLELAVALSGHENPGRRASAAALAMTCEDVAPERARRVLLRATEDVSVAAEQDVAHCLFALCTNRSADPTQRQEARDRLLELAGSKNDRIARLGGDALFALRLEDEIDDATFFGILDKRLVARTSAIHALSHLLRHPRDAEPHREWLLETAIRFAEEGGAAGLQLMEVFRAGDVTHLLDDSSFLSRLLQTRAARDHLEPLRLACDRTNHLLPIAETILQMAGNVSENGAGPSESIGADPVRSTAALLSRLVEEAEARSDARVRTAALDAWDRLLEVGDAYRLRDDLTVRLTD